MGGLKTGFPPFLMDSIRPKQKLPGAEWALRLRLTLGLESGTKVIGAEDKDKDKVKDKDATEPLSGSCPIGLLTPCPSDSTFSPLNQTPSFGASESGLHTVRKNRRSLFEHKAMIILPPCISFSFPI